MTTRPEPVPPTGTVPDSRPDLQEGDPTMTTPEPPPPVDDDFPGPEADDRPGPSPASGTVPTTGTDDPVPTPDHETKTETTEAEGSASEPGIPLGQVLVGGTSVTTIIGVVLWQLAGPLGLLAAGSVAVGSLLLVRGRRDTQRPDRRPSWTTGRGGRSGLFTGSPSRMFGGTRNGRPSGSGTGRFPVPGLGRGRSGRGGLGSPSFGRTGTGQGSGRPAGGRGRSARGDGGGWFGPRRGSGSGATGRRVDGGTAPAGRTSPSKGRATTSPRTRAGRADSGSGRAGSGAAAGGARPSLRDRLSGGAQAARKATGRTRAGRSSTSRGRFPRWQAARRAWAGSLTSSRHPIVRRAAQAAGMVLALFTLLAGWWRTRKARNNPTDSTPDSPPADSSAPTDPTPTTPDTAPASADAAAPGSAEQGEPVRDRHHNSSHRSSQRSSTMTAGFPLAAAAAEVNATAARYEAVDMWQVANDLRQLPDVFANIALAVRTYTSRLEGGFPIDKAVVEAIGQLYTGLAQIATAAQEIEPHFRRVHVEDLKRGETPRTNEPAWNV